MNKEQEPINILYARHSEPSIRIKQGDIELKHDGEQGVRISLAFELVIPDWQIDDGFENFPKIINAIRDKITYEGHLKRKIYDYMAMKKSILARAAKGSYLP